jgi:NAD-specific glutamate dehydrogenase
LSELRQLAAAAREAQERMPRYLVVAADKGADEFRDVTSLISVVRRFPAQG